jgi:hypothetical protein
MSSPCPVSCGGCSCHLSPPCTHCVEHACLGCEKYDCTDDLCGVEFKEGDLITGNDRSYKRSIYRVITLEPFVAELVSFNGYVPPPDVSSEQPLPDLYAYRLATQEEIEQSLKETQ